MSANPAHAPPPPAADSSAPGPSSERPRTLLPGRLPPEAMFPAGRPEMSVRRLALPSGVRVRALECGRPDGPPVLFLHGWACSVYTFRRNFAPLARAGFRVLAADLKGCGLSDKPLAPGEYTTEAMVAHVVEILDALGAPRAALVGHSLGGALALDVAMRFPERVSRVALLDTVGLGQSALIELVRRLVPSRFAPLLPPLARRWIIALVLRVAYARMSGFTARDVDEYWAPTQFPAAAQAALAVAHEFTWEPWPESRLRSVRAPVLAVFGTRDRLVDPRGAERLVQALPGTRVHLVRGAGHLAPEEAAEEVNTILADFFRPELLVRPMQRGRRESGAAPDPDLAAG